MPPILIPFAHTPMFSERRLSPASFDFNPSIESASMFFERFTSMGPRDVVEDFVKGGNKKIPGGRRVQQDRRRPRGYEALQGVGK